MTTKRVIYDTSAILSLLMRERLAKLLSHSRESGNPERLCSTELWIPAFAGMTVVWRGLVNHWC